MKRKSVFISLIFLLAIASYFIWFRKDKTLGFVPENADFAVLIDVKKASQQYFFSFAKHPELWFGDSWISVKNNGVKIPDFVQIFHLKNTSFFEWYSIFEISNKNDFLIFLRENGFKLIKDDYYNKDQISVKIIGSKIIIGFSNKDFEAKSTSVLNSNNYKKLAANQLINNSIGSFSYISDSQIQNFSIDLNDDNIEIQNNSGTENFSSLISNLENQTSFLRIELDSGNIKKASTLFNKKWDDSANIKSVSAVAGLEMVNDKIVNYGYDDNFNEIEKVSYQKIVQPNYAVNFISSDADKTWSYFQKNKWINVENQFTEIPFQPNIIKKKGDEILINSTRKPISQEKKLGQNFVFLKNDPRLKNSIKTLSESEKQLISNLDYIFYGNKKDAYYLKLKFKKDKLPLILRSRK